MVREGRVVAIDGTLVPIAAGTICIHGDTPGAVELVTAIRERFAADGVAVAPLGAHA
jgi:UPF0271 protein